MKKPLLALALMLLPFGMASAQVRLKVIPRDGSAAMSLNLDDIKWIDFLGDGNHFSIETRDLRYAYSFDFVQCIKFEGLLNDISTTRTAESDVRISYKEGQLFVSGMGDAVTHAAIYDLNGCSRVSLPLYKGEPIDVSNLPKGAYILRVGSRSFKFLR